MDEIIIGIFKVQSDFAFEVWFSILNARLQRYVHTHVYLPSSFWLRKEQHGVLRKFC